MLVIQKLTTIKFSKGSYKESFLEASKYAAHFIKSKYNLSFEYKKDIDNKSIIMTIYFEYNENELANHRCKVCKEFHKTFYINEETNCNSCKMTAYRKELNHEAKRLAILAKGNLKLNDKFSENNNEEEQEQSWSRVS